MGLTNHHQLMEKSDAACHSLPLAKDFLLFMPNHAIRWRACWPPGEPAANKKEGSDLTNRQREMQQTPREIVLVAQGDLITTNITGAAGLERGPAVSLSSPCPHYNTRTGVTPLGQPDSPPPFGQDTCKGSYSWEVGFLSLTLITHHLFILCFPPSQF